MFLNKELAIAKKFLISALASALSITLLATPANAATGWTEELHSFNYLQRMDAANTAPQLDPSFNPLFDEYDAILNPDLTVTSKKTTSSTPLLAFGAAANSMTRNGNHIAPEIGPGAVRSAVYVPNRQATYAIASNQTIAKHELIKITPSNVTVVAEIPSPNGDLYYQISVDNSGQVYVLGDVNINPPQTAIWKLDVETGALSDKKIIQANVGGTLSNLYYASAFSINPIDNTAYLNVGAYGFDTAGIYSVNLSSGLATLVKENSAPSQKSWTNFIFDSNGNIYRIWAGVLQTAKFTDFVASANPLFTEYIYPSNELPGGTIGEGALYFVPTTTNSGGNTGGGNSTPSSGTTTPTTSSSPTTSSTLAAGELGGLAATPPTSAPAQGTSTTTIGGTPVRTSTSSSDSADSVTSSNGGRYSSSVTFKDIDDGQTVPLTTNDTIGAEPGSDLSITGRGFKGRSQVQAYLIDANGKSTYLGKINTSLFGRVNGKLPVPSTLAAGKYTLQLNGFTRVRSLVKSTNLGMEIVQDDLGSLYFGADSSVATDETKALVKEMAKSLDAGEKVILYGYTSGNPDSKYRSANLALAQRRTNTIKALFAAEGVKSTIIIEPKGAVSPFGFGGHANNRRVDVRPTN